MTNFTLQILEENCKKMFLGKYFYVCLKSDRRPCVFNNKIKFNQVLVFSNPAVRLDFKFEQKNWHLHLNKQQIVDAYDNYDASPIGYKNISACQIVLRGDCNYRNHIRHDLVFLEVDFKKRNLKCLKEYNP